MQGDRHDDTTAPIQPPDGSRRTTRSTIGPYRLLEVLGRGGMGVVWLAEQTEPIRRTVALKVVRAGMDSKAVLARFEAERQALALMDHPGIAKVLDAGTTEQGQPYFAMEYVAGLPLPEYCDRHQLSPRQRVELFVSLCDAVQHAHQKGVIHRDLKPSNVLVTVQDSRAVPKVIDFGIAKAIGQRLTSRTLHTLAGQAIGTPAYMSPEQAGGSGLDVDTRTDIYTLGVMLYQVLVGTLPHDFSDVLRVGVAGILRDTDPPTPSARLGTLGDRQLEVARHRGATPASLRSELKGDLDWIVMKAMEKDRTRRYASANGLAMDLNRYLHHEPTTAGPPTARYRMRKFLRRNRAPVAAGVAVAGALLVGTVLATVGMVRARAAERLAEAEARTSGAINDFLEDMVASASPWRGGRGGDATIVEALDHGTERIDGSFADQPSVAAALRTTIAHSYLRLGEYDKAEALLRRALITQEQLQDVDPEDLGRTLRFLGDLFRETGRLTEAENLLQRSLDLTQTSLGESHPESVETLADYGLLLTDLARFEESVAVHERVLELRRQIYGPVHLEVALGLNDLGWTMNAARMEGSQPILAESVGMYQQLLARATPTDSSVIENFLALALANYAASYWTASERLVEADSLLRDALELNRKVWGPLHSRVATSLRELGIVAALTGDFAAARRFGEEGIAILTQMGRGNTPEMADHLESLGISLSGMGDLEGAEALQRRGVSIYRRLADQGDVRPVWLATSLNNLGFTLSQRGKCDEASTVLREATSIYAETYGESHASTANAYSHLGYCLTALGEYEEAEAALEAAVTVLERERGRQHPWTIRAVDRLADLHVATGRPAAATRSRPR